MRCNKCGSEVSGNFCTQCGEPAQPQYWQEPKKSPVVGIVVVVAIIMLVVVFAIGGLVYFVVQAGSNRDELLPPEGPLGEDFSLEDNWADDWFDETLPLEPGTLQADGWYSPGSYTIGEGGLPAGEYFFECVDFSTGYGNGTVYVMGAGGEEDYLLYEFVETDYILTLGGEAKAIEAEGVRFRLSDEVPAAPSKKTGVFRVGIDIPAGEYRLHVDPQSEVFGSASVYTNSDHASGRYDNEPVYMAFDRAVTIEVFDGELLQLSDATLGEKII